MQKAICTGETILDILFKNNQPIASVPGGSSFNCAISLARAGIPTYFLGETGDDAVGQQIVDFMKANGLHTDFFEMHPHSKTAISLAFLNDRNDAQYVFYKETPQGKDTNIRLPQFQTEDVLILGSYYAICPSLRPYIRKLLQMARENKSIIYYDLNFRKSHQDELETLMPSIIENFQQADIVRGSADDFQIMYGTHDARRIYQEHIAPHASLFICTAGADKLTVCTPDKTIQVAIPQIHTVSTIGAGDNFNAGFVYGLMHYHIKKEDLPHLSEEVWKKLITCGLHFAANVCQSVHNSIDPSLDLSDL